MDALYRLALTEFCRDLGELQAQSGVSRAQLVSRVHLGKSQLYDVLGGRIVRPPDWTRVVAPIVRHCTSGSTASLQEWRRRHGELVRLFVMAQRLDADPSGRIEATPTAPEGWSAPETGGGPGGPASATAWRIPSRNPSFTGRVEHLDELLDGFETDESVTVQVIRGLGGVGKTQLATEFAHRNRSRYGVAWWFEAEHVASLRGQMHELATALGVSRDPSADPRPIVQDHLRRRGDWLVVFDNAVRPENLHDVIPAGSGHVLVTTRHSGFGAIGRVMDLDVLERSESVTLLTRRCTNIDDVDATRLADRLGDLPLALDQAASYLERTGLTSTMYLDLLETRAHELYARGQPGPHPGTVGTVWSVSLAAVRATSTAAIDLLSVAAWLAPEPIPLGLFRGRSDLLTPSLAGVVDDPVALVEAVAVLADYSLARRTRNGFVLHRLVQGVTRVNHHPGDDARGEPHPVRCAVEVLAAALPDSPWTDPSSWARYRELLTHVLVATGYESAVAHAPESTAWLLTRTGTYLARQARHADAIDSHQRALAIYEQLYGPRDPRVADELNNLGRSLSAVGRHQESLDVQRRALAVHEAALGPTHPSVVVSLYNIGRALSGSGQHDAAVPLFERALAVQEGQRDPSPAKIATCLHFLGAAYVRVGRHADALPLHRRALAIRRDMYEEGHPDVATHLRDVADALSGLGRDTEAVPLYEQAMAIHEAAFGPGHPEARADAAGLVGSLERLRRHDDAHEIRSRLDGSDRRHPDADLSSDGPRYR